MTLLVALLIAGQSATVPIAPVDHAALGRRYYDLGYAAYLEGKADEIRDNYAAAAREFEAAGMKGEQALAYRSLTFAPGLTFDEKNSLLAKALDLAMQVKSVRVEALVRHQWGDMLLGQGEYRRALEHTERAARLLERLGDTVSLARALTSLARLFHIQGSTSEAIATYERVLGLQKQSGDVLGEAQTHSAIGALLVQSNRAGDALPHYALALDLVENNGGGAIQLNVQRAAYAMGLGNAGQFARAAELMKQVIDADPNADDVPRYYRSLAYDLRSLKRDAEADAAEVQAKRAAAALWFRWLIRF